MQSIKKILQSNRTRYWLGMLLVSLSMLLSGCGTAAQSAQGELQNGTDSQETSITETQPVLPTAPVQEILPAVRGPELAPVNPEEEGEPVTGEAPAKLLEDIRADLAERTQASREEMVVMRDQAVTWRDGSLGCPQPGMMYTQALVPGYWVVLQVGEKEYDYRASESGHFVLCEGRGLAPVASPLAKSVEEVIVPTSPTIPTPISAGLQGLIAQAKEDLAFRLSIPIEEIDLVELSAVVWPDGALGCPEPGVAYTQVQQEGLLIRLRAGKQIYPYHSGGGKPPFLCQQAVEVENLP